MSGFEMFCERCGKRYGNEETTAAESLPLGRRLLMAVGVGSTAPRPVHQEPVLRFCLACRGYSCPACWNDDAGFCQTCVPLPEPEPVAAEPDFTGVPQLVIEGAAGPYTDPIRAALFGEPASEPVAEPAEPIEEPVLESVAPETGAEPVAPELFEVEAEPVFVDAEPMPAEAEPMLAEPEPEAEPVFTEAEPMPAEPEPEAEPVFTEAEPMPAEAEPMLAEPEPEAEPAFAEPEPAVEVAYAEATSTEPEPDVQWDLNLSPEADTDAEPEVIAEPEPVLTLEPAAPEMPAIPEAPTVQPPTLPMAPIFRPLEPMGPLMPPPPPPAAALVPRIEFDLPDAPPAFLMARPPLTPALRPTLPVGLFDGPGPTVRPCPHCELPVSAKARFCRRCGSAQG